MIKKCSFITSLLLSFIFVSSQEQTPLLINLEKELDKEKAILSSSFVSDFRYVSLETLKNILIDSNPEITIDNQIVIIQNKESCLLFNLNSGKFISEVGRRGKGPNEFKTAKGFVNPTKNSIYFIGWHSNLLEFAYNGEFLSSIKIPDFNDDFDLPSISTNYTYWNDNIVSYFTNTIGDEKKLLLIFGNDGKKLCTLYNSHIYPKYRFTLTTKESDFYHFNTNLYFKENYNDTIFKISCQELIPSIVLYTGKYRKPYESKWSSNQKSNSSVFITPFNLMETEGFIFFKYYNKEKLYFGIYSKKEKELNLAEIESGINNDVDDFVSFSPMAITDNGELVGIIDAYKITQWFSKNPEKAMQLPVELKKLKNLKETDNPIIMIAKLKD